STEAGIRGICAPLANKGHRGEGGHILCQSVSVIEEGGGFVLTRDRVQQIRKLVGNRNAIRGLDTYERLLKGLNIVKADSDGLGLFCHRNQRKAGWHTWIE